MKKSLTIAAAIALMAPAMASAQKANIMAGKPVYTLGKAKTWSKVVTEEKTNEEGETTTESVTKYFTFEGNLELLTKVPQNTDNVFLFPEAQDGGNWNNEGNREIGIQGFYVDLGEVKTINTINTTWEGAAANSYDIYVVDNEPTLDVLTTQPTYTQTNLGQYKENTAELAEGTSGRYVVFQPTDASNWGWGVKIRSISAYGSEEAILTTFEVSSNILFGQTAELILTLKDQNGEIVTTGYEIFTSDNASYDSTTNKMTITSGKEATITVKKGDVELSQTIYLVPDPTVPLENSIRKAIFTSNAQDPSYEYYAGGAINMGLKVFSNGQIGQYFEDGVALYIWNQNLGGEWNHITTTTEETAELGKYLRFSIFVFNDCDLGVWFNDNGADSTVSLIGEQWNDIEISIIDKVIQQISFRFGPEGQKDEIKQNFVLANVYTTGASVPTGVSAVAEVEGAVNVYNMQGVLLKENVNAAEALEGLAKGMYVVGNKKVVK